MSLPITVFNGSHVSPMASLLKIISTADAKQLVLQVYQPIQGIQRIWPRWCYGCNATHLQATFLALQNNNNMVEELHCIQRLVNSISPVPEWHCFSIIKHILEIFMIEHVPLNADNWFSVYIHLFYIYIYILNLSSTLDSIDVSPSLRSFSICTQSISRHCVACWTLAMAYL